MRPAHVGLALTFLSLIPFSATSQTSTAPQAHSSLTPGQVLPRIQCAARPEQSYALYLPSNYSPDRRWPLVVSSDPGAKGPAPLELQKNAAEEFGYVLVASNNSRNGPWKPRLEATDAMLHDVQARVSIDLRRVYFAGFSGGARASAQFALLCKCAAGVFLTGAGFPGAVSSAADSVFPVYSAIGIFDFNYPEVIELQDALSKAGYPHWLRIFDGIHEWAPSGVMREAFAWFRIQAMKTQREALDRGFIDKEFAASQARAKSLQDSGDLLNAWREYLQIAATFDSFEDVTGIRVNAETLGKEKVVRDAAKRERNEFAEQSALTANITAAIAGSDKPSAPSSDNSYSATDDIRHLRDLANEEKKPEKARVYKRALSGVFILAMESGSGFLDTKAYDRAIQAFEAATQARADSEWAWRELAVAYADAGKTKQALAALREARHVSTDLAAFVDWLKAEPAFERLRSTPEFANLTVRN